MGTSSSTVPSPDAFEFIGRLKGYAKDFEGAVATFSAGLELYPEDARLYRHRAHRYISLRRIAEARDDFLQAVRLLPAWTGYREYGQAYVLAQLEATVLGDWARAVQPSVERVRARGEYLSSLAFKVHYHLGLCWHLLGQDPEALACFEQSLREADQLETQVAAANWLVVLHGHLGLSERDADLLAAIDLNGTVRANAAYADLLRVYASQLAPDALAAAAKADRQVMATAGYGLANYFLARGEPERGLAMLRRVVAEGDPAAFGTIAAELLLARGR